MRESCSPVLLSAPRSIRVLDFAGRLEYGKRVEAS
jgi:hypothetical protein